MKPKMVRITKKLINCGGVKRELRLTADGWYTNGVWAVDRRRAKSSLPLPTISHQSRVSDILYMFKNATLGMKSEYWDKDVAKALLPLGVVIQKGKMGPIIIVDSGRPVAVFMPRTAP